MSDGYESEDHDEYLRNRVKLIDHMHMSVAALTDLDTVRNRLGYLGMSRHEDALIDIAVGLSRSLRLMANELEYEQAQKAVMESLKVKE